MKKWIIASILVIMLVVFSSSFYVINLNGTYAKSNLVSSEDSVLCYEQTSCKCLGSLAIAETMPVLGYHCNGFEFCLDDTQQKCFDMNAYYESN